MKSVDPQWIRGPSDELAIEEGCTFDPAAGEKPIQFCEHFCRQSKDPFAGQPLILQDWQKDFNRRLYGWKRADGSRRYRKFYLEVPKKNGKSTMQSGLKLNNLVADDEWGAEVYIAGYTLQQARIVFDEAVSMVRFSPSLSNRLKIVASTKHIIYPARNAKLVALSADVPSKDGINASDVTFDELHRQATPELWDVLKYAGTTRRQPFLGAITTAGFDRESVCYRQHDYARKVNSGLIKDTAHLGVIYGASANDDIEDPAVWRKANPSMGVTFSEADFSRELREALACPATLNNFLRLRLNIWTSSSERFISRDKWDRCGKNPIDEASLSGEPCWSGLDLASTTDIAALIHVFGSFGNLKVLCRFWVPEDSAQEREKRDRVPYLDWARRGLITLTPGGSIDYEYIRAQVNVDAKRFRIQKLHCDPWNATHLVQQLIEADGIPVDFMRQGFLSMNAPVKELDRLVSAGQLDHGDNAVLNWMCDNCVIATDAAGNLKLDKKKSREKIDGMIGLVMGISAKMTDGADAASVYDSEGITSF